MNLDAIREMLDEYHDKHRHPDKCPLAMSRLYLLHTPEGERPDWPDHYFPSAECPGVYLILSKDKKVLYIGKASWNNTLGSRLGTHFRNGSDSVCVPVHRWTEEPAYIVTIPFCSKNAFEAAALEEFLITGAEGDLPDNTIGNS